MWQRLLGYAGMAAVTASPATRNDRPPIPTLSPTRTPRASAKPRSITTVAGRIQPPSVTFGWSTEAGAWSRPSATTNTLCPPNWTVLETVGYGPLWAITPGAVVSEARLARVGASRGPFIGCCAIAMATTSGPAVACRVCWYGLLVTPLSANAIVRVVAAAAMTKNTIRASTGRRRRSRTARRQTSKSRPISRVRAR